MPLSSLEKKYNKDARVDKFLSEYKDKKILYENFCTSVISILKNLLDEAGYKYQIIYRMKTEESLREKIVRKMAQGKIYKKLGDIEDLAGIRIIFYVDSDKKNFAKHFYENFDAGRIKIVHHNHKNGYKAIHTIFSFGPKRTKLIEYKNFKGLKCEIQITSILYHAWAEFEHDIFYKPKGEQKNRKDTKTFGVYREKLKNVLYKYINDAVREFEEIAENTGMSHKTFKATETFL